MRIEKIDSNLSKRNISLNERLSLFKEKENSLLSIREIKGILFENEILKLGNKMIKNMNEVELRSNLVKNNKIKEILKKEKIKTTQIFNPNQEYSYDIKALLNLTHKNKICLTEIL